MSSRPRGVLQSIVEVIVISLLASRMFFYLISMTAAVGVLWAVLAIGLTLDRPWWFVYLTVDYTVALATCGVVVWVVYLVLSEFFLRAGSRVIVGFFALGLVALIGDFAFVYLALQRDVPNAFSGGRMTNLDALYLATTTITTVGGGAIYPTAEASRASVIVETLLGLGVIGVGVSVLVARLIRSSN